MVRPPASNARCLSFGLASFRQAVRPPWRGRRRLRRRRSRRRRGAARRSREWALCGARRDRAVDALIREAPTHLRLCDGRGPLERAGVAAMARPPLVRGERHRGSEYAEGRLEGRRLRRHVTPSCSSNSTNRGHTMPRVAELQTIMDPAARAAETARDGCARRASSGTRRRLTAISRRRAAVAAARCRRRRGPHVGRALAVADASSDLGVYDEAGRAILDRRRAGPGDAVIAYGQRPRDALSSGRLLMAGYCAPPAWRSSTAPRSRPTSATCTRRGGCTPPTADRRPAAASECEVVEGSDGAGSIVIHEVEEQGGAAAPRTCGGGFERAGAARAGRRCADARARGDGPLPMPALPDPSNARRASPAGRWRRAALQQADSQWSRSTSRRRSA